MKRINKRTARKLFNEKKDFLIITCIDFYKGIGENKKCLKKLW